LQFHQLPTTQLILQVSGLHCFVVQSVPSGAEPGCLRGILCAAIFIEFQIITRQYNSNQTDMEVRILHGKTKLSENVENTDKVVGTNGIKEHDYKDTINNPVLKPRPHTSRRNGRAVAQLASHRSGPGSCTGSMWGLWWTKRHWGMFSLSTSVSPANISTDFSIIIITRG
jgi:hypothetical protein